jgi:hypothetical protein
LHQTGQDCANGCSWYLYEVAFKIEVIEKSGEVTSPHPAGFGRARPRARPSARRLLLLPGTCWAPAAAPYRAGSSSGHGELRGGGHSQKIVPGLEAFNHVRNVKPGPERSEGPLSKDRARTGHSQKGVLTKHRTLNLKRLTSGHSASANPNEVRVRGAKLPELFSFFWYSFERKLVLNNKLYNFC